MTTHQIIALSLLFILGLSFCFLCVKSKEANDKENAKSKRIKEHNQNFDFIGTKSVVDGTVIWTKKKKAAYVPKDNQ